MPEIDADLFEFATLVLLALVALLLLFLLGVATGVKKTVQKQLDELQRISRPGLELGAADQPEVSDEVATAEPSFAVADLKPSPEPDLGAEAGLAPEPDVAREPDLAPEPQVEPEPEVPAASAEPGPAAEVGPAAELPSEPAAEEPLTAPAESTGAVAGTSGEGLAGWERQEDAFAEQYDAAAPEEVEDPFSREPTAAHTTEAGAEAVAAETPESGAAETPEAEPQDQPFERNGRWYFRRGDELLRYEEGTGEWVAAEPDEIATTPSHVGAGWSEPETAGVVEDAAPSEQATARPSEEAASAPDEAEFAEEPARFEVEEDETATVPQPAAGGFWKCASCGAVNGSSAVTCRMCFSARP